MTDTNELRTLGGRIHEEYEHGAGNAMLKAADELDALRAEVAEKDERISSLTHVRTAALDILSESVSETINRLTARVAELEELQRREARDWSEAHDALLAATGTVVDEGNVTGQPPLIDLVGRLTAERDALREELTRLKEAVWPGLPKFVSTPEKPQEDFYILVAEGLRAIFESHREPEGEPNEQAQNSDGEPAAQDAGKAD